MSHNAWKAFRQLRYSSVRFRITLFVAALFAAVLVATGLTLMLVIQAGYQKQIFQRQFELISNIADNLDDEIDRAKDYLVRLSYLVPADRISDRAFIQNFVMTMPRSHPFFDTFFDRGLFIFSPSGDLVGEYPALTPAHGSNYAGRDFFHEPVTSRKPYISRPFLGDRAPRKPVVIFSVPMTGPDGKLLGVLSAAIDLTGRNILQKFIGTRVGETGYFYLYDTSRTIILHPDTNRILKRDVPLGINRLFDAGIAGYEGSMETVNSRGLRAIATVKRIPSAGWLLAANYPLSEAYAPIRGAWTAFLLMIAAALAFTVFAVRLLIRSELRPLTDLRERIHALGSRFQDAEAISVPDPLEFRELALAFNSVTKQLKHWVGELQESERFIQKITNTVPDILYIFDLQAMRITYFNAKAIDFTGLLRDEMNSPGTELPRSLIHPLDLPEYYSHLERVRNLSDSDVAIVKYRIRDRRNEWHWVLSREAVFQRNTSGGVKLVIGASTEITQQVKFEEELREKNRELEDANEALAELAITDGLTKLFNHRFIIETLRLELRRAHRYATRLSIVMLDIDFFKKINDRFGHSAGDRVLIGVSDSIASSLRNIDFAGRYGGEEFLVILPQTDLAGARIVAERIRENIEHLRVPGHPEAVTISGGIAEYSGQTAEKLVEEADDCLYQAKREGRNRIEFREDK